MNYLILFSVIASILIGSSIVIYAGLTPNDNGTFTFTHYDGLTFTTRTDGSTNIKNDHKDNLGDFSFILSTPSANYSSNIFTWTWSTYNYTVKERYINESMDYVYVTRTIEVLKATNNNNKINITQEWIFHPMQSVKIKTTIFNNLGVSINNSKFWYVNKVPLATSFIFDNNQYTIDGVNDINLDLNLVSAIPQIKYAKMGFEFSDLIANGYQLSNVYAGSGASLNRTEYLVAIAISLPLIKNLATVVLDPLVTSYYSPANAGSPLSQWTNPTYVISSNNQRATETRINEAMDTANYSISLPTGVTVVGIEISVEGRGGSCMY